MPAFFFVHELNPQNESIILDEDTSRHITQVLRMKVGEELILTNGKGIKAYASIINDHRKKCEVKVAQYENIPAPKRKVAIAISLLKNATRFEWFLEKATEIGVTEIIPLHCVRTEKEKFRYDRMKNITISAMLQSQQCWLPVLHEPTEYNMALQIMDYTNRYIAHCLPEEKTPLNQSDKAIILIGPEGDFTPAEIEAARTNGFEPVTLGNNRLRTETAGMVAATLLCIGD